MYFSIKSNCQSKIIVTPVCRVYSESNVGLQGDVRAYNIKPKAFHLVCLEKNPTTFYPVILDKPYTV